MMMFNSTQSWQELWGSFTQKHNGLPAEQLRLNNLWLIKVLWNHVSLIQFSWVLVLRCPVLRVLVGSLLQLTWFQWTLSRCQALKQADDLNLVCWSRTGLHWKQSLIRYKMYTLRHSGLSYLQSKKPAGFTLRHGQTNVKGKKTPENFQTPSMQHRNVCNLFFQTLTAP